ncbi:sigma-54 interaction domain-containing protein [Anaerobacillus sp. MEB173]|uniref:sigma-54 interaction domain-containing protein n=1 Tax=Anaerobacillus sp. MEB173 TaxID=3383345 RepID=UPI003F8F7AD6
MYVSNKINKIGFFYVDLKGKVKYFCSKLSENFKLDESDFVGLTVNHVLKSQVSEKQLFEMAQKNQTVFGVIKDEPCLIHISSCSEEEKSNGYTCHVVLRARDIRENDVLEFWKSMNSQNKSKEKRRNKNAYSHRYSFENIIGSSPAMNEVVELASKVAKGQSTIMISGESGTGKELFAQAIHDLSPRREGPFVAVNCTAIPEQLFESELFGYEGGAFSGAKRDGKAGKVELAHNGTLFLDEISELPLLLQGKLLRVLQEREIERIGGIDRKDINVRIIAATNKSLKKLIDEGKFREDLYYRLQVFELKIPALRYRNDDIIPLAYYFIEKFNNQLGLSVKHIEPTLKHWLLNYHWPGNVRELQAKIERGMNIVEGDTLLMKNMGAQSDSNQIKEPTTIENYLPLKEEVANAEIKAISRALKKSNGDRMAAAQLLKIHIASLYRKLEKYNMKEI